MRISTAFKQTDTPIRVRKEPRKQRRVCVYVQIIQWGLKLMLRDVRVVQAPGKRTKTIHCSGNVHGEPGETRATKTGNGGDDARGEHAGDAGNKMGDGRDVMSRVRRGEGMAESRNAAAWIVDGRTACGDVCAKPPTLLDRGRGS